MLVEVNWMLLDVGGSELDVAGVCLLHPPLHTLSTVTVM